MGYISSEGLLLYTHIYKYNMISDNHFKNIGHGKET